MSYHDDALDLCELADHLIEESGTERTPLPPRSHKLLTAAGLIHQAAELLLELDVGDELAVEVRALQVLCHDCGHDRGDHLAEAPHLCECTLEWFNRTTGKLVNVCNCSGFVPVRRDTLPDLMTEPSPPLFEVR